MSNNANRAKLTFESSKSIDKGELSDSELSGVTSPISPVPRQLRPQQYQQQAALKKKRLHNHSYRRRRENKILNESSDMENYITPPSSPAASGASTPAMSSWNENPVFSTDAAASSATVDISALDDALHDFEQLSKTFEPPLSPHNKSQVSKNSTNPKKDQVEPSLSSSASRDQKIKTFQERDKNRPHAHLKNLANYDFLGSASRSFDHIPSTVSNSYHLHTTPLDDDNMIGLSAPDLKAVPSSQGGESREMIDLIDIEAPDNTLIKPSKLRASLRSKRRHTQEIVMRQEHEPSPGDTRKSPDQNWTSIFDRSSSFRDKSSSLKDELNDPKFRRVKSLREQSRTKEKVSLERGKPPVSSLTTTSPVSNELRKQEPNNNVENGINGRISPTQVSRPLQLALDMNTGAGAKLDLDMMRQDMNNSPGAKQDLPMMTQDMNTSPEAKDSARKRQDSFTSSTKVQLHSTSPVKSPSPSRKLSPFQVNSSQSDNTNLPFTTESSEDHYLEKVMFPSSLASNRADENILSTRRRTADEDDTENVRFIFFVSLLNRIP